jgi:predicted metalloprotease with PDZ domain
MMRSKTLVLGILIAISAPMALSQHCVQFNDRPNGGCFETGCEIYCALANKTIESRLMPGFFTEPKAGGIVVTGVLPSSPASVAGVQVGDVLLGIDGLAVPFDGIDSAWQEGERHTIRLKRGSLLLTERIETKTVQRILSQLPAMSNPVKLASFSFEQPPFSAEPFLSGMLVHRDGDEFAVDTVLRNSPAERAGIRPGDHLTGIKGEADAFFLQYSNEREQ